MNILWIEDFGSLPAGRNILNQMFGNLLSFDSWDNDVLSLISKPTDLNEFCTQQKSLHTVYLCRNYFDYAEFKQQHNIINEIDVMILDIRLDDGNHVDFSLPIPEPYEDKTVFHENGGFYIFNDLVHLGVSAEKICFMTGEDSTFGEFQKKCVEIYMPKVNCFVKKPDNTDYEKLRVWLGKQESDYSKLRRGIIEGCRYLKKELSTITKKEQLQFNECIKKAKQVDINEISDFLEILESFLPLRKPSNTASLYKLFIRTLSHEWEAAEPERIKVPRDKTQFAFSQIMKTTRNWITHNPTAIFNHLTAQDVAYLFVCNMRAMFKLNSHVEKYESILFSLFNENDVTLQSIQSKIKNHEILLIEKYVSHFDESNKNKVDIYEIINGLQDNKQKVEQHKNDSFFITMLYQLFWFLNASKDDKTKNIIAEKHSKKPHQVIISRPYSFEPFDYAQSEFLLKFASHIYTRSF